MQALKRPKLSATVLLIFSLVLQCFTAEIGSTTTVSVSSNPSLKASAGSIKAHFTCAWLSQLYVDGNPLPPGPHTKNINQSDVFFIPSGHHVIAIYCIARLGPRGLLGYFEDGQVTDASWKCTNKYYGGWHLDFYDDFHWSSAHEIRTNAQSSVPVTDVRKNAWWIWTNNLASSAWQLYCRKRIHIVKTGGSPIPMFFSVLENKDHALTNHAIKSTHVAGVLECFTKCAQMVDWCLSFNYQYDGSGSESALCELNNATKDQVTEKLVSRTGFVYYEIQGP